MNVIIPDSAAIYLAAQRPVKAGSLDGNKVDVLERDVDRALSILPKVESILDIGCGVGLTTLHLKRALGVEICGLDGTGMDPIRSGYGKSKGPWNSAEVTRELWRRNGEDIRLYEIGERIDRKFDLLVSFAAWGWHFRLDTYDAALLLNKPGYVAVDRRAGDERHGDWKLLSSYPVNPKRTFCLFQVQ